MADFVKGEAFAKISINSGIAVGRVKKVPVSRGKFGHERQDGVAKHPHGGHGANFFKIVKTVAFG
ncbi:hypothetical protein JZU68_04455, partial [bacterium]|nr:hypothetical protein [bacterium]